MRRLLLALLLPLAACDAADPCAAGCAGGDEVVAGVNLTRLFDAPVTGAERDAVAAAWAARDDDASNPATRPVLEEVVRTTDATDAELVVLAAFPPDATLPRDTLFVAAVRRPRHNPGDVRRRPLLLVLPDGPADARTLPDQAALSELWTDEVVMATVAPRGEALLAGGRTFGASVAPGEAYLTDADDARTLLAALPALEPFVDASRLAAVGHGRGGTAALALAARRVPSLGLAASLGAPTSFVTFGVRDDARAFLTSGAPRSQIPALPEVLAATVGAVRDGTATLGEARFGLLVRSPGAFVTPPPLLVAAHGVLDTVVPVDQLGGLAGVVGQPDAIVLRLDEATHESVVQHSEVVSLVTARARLAFGWP